MFSLTNKRIIDVNIFLMSSYTMYSNELPIGVFDSGVGGLTVLKALQTQLPNEHFIYLGDTARLPYGTKTPKTICAYAIQAVNFLITQKIKFLVIACNTATALALPTLKAHFPNLPIIGVIEPGARTALALSQNKNIAIIATQATVNSKGYDEAILQLNPNAKVSSKAASLLVAIAEEGLLTGMIPKLAVAHYLEPLLQEADVKADTLLLGCTHFPVLHQVIHEVVAGRMQIIDSAHSVALQVKKFFVEHPELAIKKDHHLRMPIQFLVTDGVGRFMQVAKYFLEMPIAADDINLVDIYLS